MKSQRNPAPDAAVEAIKAVWEAMRRYGDPNDHVLALAAIDVLSVNQAQATDARVEIESTSLDQRGGDEPSIGGLLAKANESINERLGAAEAKFFANSAQSEKALNYLRDAVTVRLPLDEIARRARLLLDSLIPANPEQVTDEMVDAALNSWFNGEILVSFSGDFRPNMRAALTAAIGAGGQVVEDEISPYEWLAQEFERLAILRKMWTADEVAATIRRHDIERPALSQPHPADERVVRALREAGCTTEDGSYVHAPMKEVVAALAKEGR